MLAKPKLDLKDAIEMCRTQVQTRQKARYIEEVGRPANRLSTSSQMEDGVFLSKPQKDILAQDLVRVGNNGNPPVVYAEEIINVERKLPSLWEELSILWR